MDSNSQTIVDYVPSNEDLKIYSDFCKDTFSSERGLWVLPSSLSIFLVDTLEGVFNLLVGNKDERSTRESIIIIEKLGYTVETKGSKINSDYSDVDLAKEVGIETITDWISAEEQTMNGFISCKSLRLDAMISYHKILKELEHKEEEDKYEIERCKRFSLLLKTLNNIKEEDYIKVIIMAGRK